jgi:membrane protease YdiL (CAAX protease family)
LVIGLAAFGLALVVTGVQLYRRNRARGAGGSSEEEVDDAAAHGEEEPLKDEGLPAEGEAQKNIQPGAFQRDFPLDYFVLVFVLSTPFWLISSLLGNKLPIPINLPISVFIFVVPVIAASILAYRRTGLRGVKGLIRRALDYRKIKKKIWYLPTLFLIPVIYWLSYVIMRWTGSPLPDPIHVPVLMAPVFFILFFIGATCEELGWTGYALDPMQSRWGALRASIILGVIWQIWHIIGNVQQQHAASWILWHGLYSVALRILIVWTYNNTGKSAFAAILVHTMDNVSVFLFPNYGSHNNPFVTGVITWVTAGVVTILWGPKTLARYRFAGANPI